MQMPQELASLTTLTELNLRQNPGHREAANALRHAVPLVPKMRVTEQSCRFLLHIPVLRTVYLTVTPEEKSALSGLHNWKDPQVLRNGPRVLSLELSQEYVSVPF